MAGHHVHTLPAGTFPDHHCETILKSFLSIIKQTYQDEKNNEWSGAFCGWDAAGNPDCSSGSVNFCGWQSALYCKKR